MAQLKNEIAERELIKAFRHLKTWLARVKSKNNWVGNDVIKIPRRGAAPDVLINNNIYPIVKNDREDDFIILGLNKYETTNTTVSDDELETLPYEKLSDVQVQHREELEDKTQEHALYSLAPSAHTAKTPVLETTGADDGTGRKRLISADVINYKKKLDDLKVPKKGRILVLCSTHVQDLLLEDKAFEKQYHNHNEGSIAANYYGFEVYEDLDAVYYKDVAGTMTKEAFEATPVGNAASVVIFADNCVKATGSVKRYMREAANDPENRENTIGFKLYFIAVAIKDEGMGAIVSGTV